MHDELHYLLWIISTLVVLMTAARAFAFWMRREWGAMVTALIGSAVASTFIYAPDRIANWLRAALDAPTSATRPARDTPPPAARPEGGNEGVDIPWDTVAIGAVALLGAAVVLGLAVGGRHLLRRRITLRQRRADLEERHNAVLDAYAAFTTDILAVLDRPALADVTVPETERLIHALDAARDARAYADADYRAAVGELEIAWTAADRTARKQGTSLFPDNERRAVEQARLLLATALDEGGNSHERQLAYHRAMRLIRDVVEVPQAAVAALEECTRLSLPVSK